MNKNTIRFVIILAIASILGILILQIIFLRKTAELNQKQLYEATNHALQNVGDKLAGYNSYADSADMHEVEVKKLDVDIYLVNVGKAIDSKLLPRYMVREFKHFKIYEDFEYEIHCKNQRQATKRVSFRLSKDSTFIPVTNQLLHYIPLPKNNTLDHYFVVYFPERAQMIEADIQTWYMADIILIITILFLAYAVYVIFQQKQMSEIQKNFVNNLTHEFKTPIAAIKLSTQVLENPKTWESPRRMQQYTNIINEQTTRLTKQVESILQVASLDKHDFKVETEQLELNTFLENTIIEFKNSLLDGSSEINFEPYPLKLKVRANPLHFSNIIYNLLDNAIKYCDGKAIINVKLAKQEQAVCLSISDNGIGIPKKYHKKIFNRFFRVPTGDIHNVKGFGLGLDYVQKMIKFHHWKINLKENSPKGTQFIITIKDYDEF